MDEHIYVFIQVIIQTQIEEKAKSRQKKITHEKAEEQKKTIEIDRGLKR